MSDTAGTTLTSSAGEATPGRESRGTRSQVSRHHDHQIPHRRSSVRAFSKAIPGRTKF